MTTDALSTLTDPVILFFVLGLVAGAVRSTLEIPAPVTRFLSLYLLMAIGFKGGQALAASGVTAEGVVVLGLALVLSLTIPTLGYRVLRGRVPAADAAAIAATYGSVSAVTFVAASQFLSARGEAVGGHMTVALVVMETPAIVLAVVLANRARSRRVVVTREPVAAGVGGVATSTPTAAGPLSVETPTTPPRIGALLRTAFTEGTFVLLVGSLVVGAASGSAGAEAMSPFVVDLFKGLLAFFLLDLGLVVARQLREVRAITPFLAGFALVTPLVGAALALTLGALAGLGLGDLTLLMVLAASGSYIVVPAIARVAIPESLPSRYLTMALGFTFPFNIVVGIPLYHHLAGLVA
ncbi:sodium-dependent bicarbonate transport family permease [Nocardioides sp.]|uniref:sodium-dependent bicarbonate transport family permease n=1 Tax=Nocardioides sp. TaxID=35761 RepID=UPI00351559F8